MSCVPTDRAVKTRVPETADMNSTAMYHISIGVLVVMASFILQSAVTDTESALPEKVGFHRAVYDADGKLLAWTTWDDAIDREMNWYLNCPLDPHGYPIFVFTTFMDEHYKPYRTDTIPCTQLGMGIISYLKYWEYKGKSNAKVVEWARKMGDYLVKETLTPETGVYPRFTRSTGCLLYTSPSPRDRTRSRMPSSA